MRMDPLLGDDSITPKIWRVYRGQYLPERDNGVILLHDDRGDGVAVASFPVSLDDAEALKLQPNDVMEIEVLIKFSTECFRCAGDAICKICQKKYREHPMEGRILDSEGRSFIHRICDGTLAKL